MSVLYHEELRRKTLAGMDKLADAVKYTLGPMGRNVAMNQRANLRDAEYSDNARMDTGVLITNDGATIAKSVILADPVENMGAQLLREAAVKTDDAAGDGTSTAIVLTQGLLHSAFRCIAAGAEPMALCRGMQEAGKIASRELSAAARRVVGEEELTRVAAISCEDEELGALIGKALHRVGLEGVITVDDSQTCETTLELQEGIVFDRGFIHPEMTTDERQTIAELHDPYILICDSKFSDPQDLLPTLILAAEDERSCLIISDGVEGDALGLILKNKTEGDMDIVCVTAPLYGEGRRWRMEDMAVQTGGVFITREAGRDVRQISRELLGSAARVKVTRGQTVITGGGGDPAAVAARISEIRSSIAGSDYAFNTERYRERLAKFISGVALLRVGGRTRTELWERKMRAEDAVNAARAACEEGVVPGGGVALLMLSPLVDRFAQTLDGDRRIGAKIVAEVLRTPAIQILNNAGLDGNVIAERLLGAQPGTGYDVRTDQFLSMASAGIEDPVKVTRTAWESALSVSTTLLTTEAGVQKDGAVWKEREKA